MCFSLHSTRSLGTCRVRMCTPVELLRRPCSILFAQPCKQHIKSRHLAAAERQASASATASFGTEEGLVYGGLCSTCGAQHFLRPTSEALAAAADLIMQLDATQRIDFDAEEADPRFSTDFVWSKGPGRMFGVLVCHDSQGQHVVLKAFSGQMTEEWHVPGWVGPVAGITAASPQYISYRQLTEQLSSRINSIQSTIKHHQLAAASKGAGAQDTSVSAKASKRKQKQRHHQVRQQDSALLALQEHQSQLTAARKALSHELLLHIQDSYCTQDIKGRHLHLLEVYESYCHLSGEEPNHLIYAGASPRCKPAGAKGREWQSQQQHLLAKQQQHADSAASASAARKVVSFPAGTGDCCAPKLIHAAMQARLTPVGLVEFWYGAPPGTATKPKAGRQLQELLASASRVHKQCYPMCSKCSTILGTMLCGLEEEEEEEGSLNSSQSG